MDLIIGNDCSPFLSSETLSLLGTNPTCVWSSASVLDVIFGSDPLFSLTDDVVIMSNVFRTAADRPLNPNEYVLDASAIENPPVAVAVITGPNQIGACDDAVFSATMSYGNAARSLTYTWTLTSELNPGVDATLLSDLNDILTTAGNVASVTLLELVAGDYVITLDVSNWMGGADTTTFAFTRNAVPVPILSMTSPAITSFVSASPDISVIASPPNMDCTADDTDDSNTFTFAWSQIEGPTIDFTFPTVSLWTLPAYTLQAGTVYKFQVEVTYIMDNDESSATSELSITTSVSDLVAVLSPGDSLQSKDNPQIVFDATESFDPDSSTTDPESFVYAWSCVTAGGVDCMTGQADAATTESTFTYDTTSSSPDETYTFSVTVGDGAGRETTTSSVLSFTVDTVPIVTLTTE